MFGSKLKVRLSVEDANNLYHNLNVSAGSVNNEKGKHLKDQKIDNGYELALAQALLKKYGISGSFNSAQINQFRENVLEVLDQVVAEDHTECYDEGLSIEIDSDLEVAATVNGDDCL